MPPAAIKISGLQIQLAQLGEIFGAHARKFVQQLPERLTLNFAFVAPAVKRNERFGVSKFENHLHPGNPVRALAVDQMAHYLKRAPGFFALVTVSPGFRHVAQQSIERSWS